MNFDDMQVAWKGQHPAKAGTQAASLDAKLLERIRRNQAGYTRTMALVVLTQVIAVGMLVALIVCEVKLFAHTPPKRVVYEFRFCLGAGVALLIALAIIIARRVPGIYSILAERSTLSLSDRIHRDARRYRFGGVVADGAQLIVGLLQMALVIVLSSRVGLHGPLRWVASGLVTVPVLAVLGYRLSLRSLRPRLGQSLAEALEISIRQTQARVRRVEQGWWQAGLTVAGFILSMEPLWFNHDASDGWALVVMLMILVAVPLLRIVARNRVRQLVQPRLKELEALRAGLGCGDQ